MNRAGFFVPALLSGLLILALFELVSADVFLVGDGLEYACTAHSFAQTGRPFARDWVLAECAKLTGWPLDSVVPGFVATGAAYDAIHFWLVSLLAAPFWALMYNSGNNPLQSFTILHLLIGCVLAFALPRIMRVSEGTIALLITFCSPLAFFTNKAHAEVFVVGSILLAFALIRRGEYGFASFVFAVASLQQLTLVVFAIAAAMLFFTSEAVGTMRRSRVLVILAGFACAAVGPAYYLLRHGRPTLLSYSVDRRLASVHRAASLFVDPDIGLFPNWPLGLLALVFVGLGFLIAKGRAEFARLVLLSAAFCVVMAAVVSMQVNWNHGGTIHVSRYALYFIPPIAVTGACAISRLLEPFGTRAPAVTVLLCLGILAYGIGWNLRLYSPVYNHVYLSHSPFARWLYAHHPGLYDPVAEIFLERGVGYEIYQERLTPEDWAVGNPDCTKLFLLKPVAEIRTITKPADPVGCSVRPNRVLDRFKTENLQPTAAGYINLR